MLTRENIFLDVPRCVKLDDAAGVKATEEVDLEAIWVAVDTLQKAGFNCHVISGNQRGKAVVAIKADTAEIKMIARDGSYKA